jgi:hypothetical protein
MLDKLYRINLDIKQFKMQSFKHTNRLMIKLLYTVITETKRGKHETSEDRDCLIYSR